MPLCACGCNVEVKNKFILGHNARVANPWTGRDWKFNKGKKLLGNEKNPAWKGDNASIEAKHQWIARHYGKADKCEFDITHKAQRYHWSNKGHTYKRIREDWQMLCPECHFKFDGRTNSILSDEIKNKISNGLKKAYASGRRKPIIMTPEIRMKISKKKREK